MLMTFLPMVRPIRPLLENAETPMLVTPLPIVTLVRLLQLLNAVTPMERTLSGIVTLARLME
jgi:hypothetical protein